MAHVNLQAQTRTILGNKVKALRRSGYIPAVIYSHKTKSNSLQVNSGQFLKAYKQAGGTNVIDLNIENEGIFNCIIQDMDIHPVTGVVRHIDFLAVDLKEKVIATVPLIIVGESKAIKESGGVLIHNLQEAAVEALPDNIPSEILVDISKLESYDSVIYVKDLPTSDKYQITNDIDLVVASIGRESKESDTQDESVPVEVEKTDLENTKA